MDGGSGSNYKFCFTYIVALSGRWQVALPERDNTELLHALGRRVVYFCEIARGKYRPLIRIIISVEI